MSTTDILLTDILNGLSPPSTLTDINKSIIALQGKLTEVIGKLNTDLTDAVGKVTGAIGKVTGAIGELRTDLIKVIEKELERDWVDYTSLGLGVAGLGYASGVLPAAAPIVSTSGAVLGGGAMAGLAAAMGTVGLIVASIVAIVASIALVVIYWKDIKAFGSKFMKVFKEIGTILKQIIIDYFKNLGDALNTIATNFANTIKQISNTIKTTVMQVVTDIVSTYQFIGTSILQIGDIIGTTIVNLITNMTQHFVDLGTNLATIFVTHIVDPIKTGLNILMDKLKGPITWFFDQLKKITSWGGGVLGKIFGGDNSTKQIAPDLTKVATVVNTPNKEDLVTNGNKITFNTSMFGNSSHGAKGSSSTSNTNSTHHHQNVYNIANIDIADGMISDLEDLIQAINRHAC